jgi:hypothetical protein
MAAQPGWDGQPDDEPPDWVRDTEKDAEGERPQDRSRANEQEGGHSAAQEGDAQDEAASAVGLFPKSAWRGAFADYREAMEGTTEASDVFHFTSLWAGLAATLQRKVNMYSGDTVYPNVNLMNFGSTMDKKTTAQRRITGLGFLGEPEETGVQVVREVGSPEGMAEALRDSGLSNFLFSWEEFSRLSGRARWSGSTWFDDLAELFDCPPEWRLRYRRDKKNPLVVKQPTISILTSCTPAWFWKFIRPEDFFGGFGNRFLYFTGKKKPPIPDPRPMDVDQLRRVKAHFNRLLATKPCAARWMPKAQKLWEEFYCEFERANEKRHELLAAALKRTHIYVRKLAMTYAACEETLPDISEAQLQASIDVIHYSIRCTEQLIDLQAVQSKPGSEVEKRCLDWVRNHEGETVRRWQQKMHRYCGDAATFNRVKRDLRESDQVVFREDEEGVWRVYLSKAAWRDGGKR